MNLMKKLVPLLGGRHQHKLPRIRHYLKNLALSSVSVTLSRLDDGYLSRFKAEDLKRLIIRPEPYDLLSACPRTRT